MSWFFAMFSTELKRIISYRMDFWLQFVGSITVDIAVAYFLWSAIYSVHGTREIGGYSLTMMILYSVFAAFGGRIVRGNERMIIATDIYEGGLTKYLLYPVTYVFVIGAYALAYDVITVLQMGVGLFLLFAIFGIPGGYSFHWSNMLMGASACLSASVFYYIIYVTIDYLAFWVDTVGSISYMFRFTAQFLSGLFIPLELFPKTLRHAIYFTPFPYIGAEPVKMFLGRSTWGQWAHTNFVIFLWSIPLAILMQFVWSRGLKNYSGVGI